MTDDQPQKPVPNFSFGRSCDHVRELPTQKGNLTEDELMSKLKPDASPREWWIEARGHWPYVVIGNDEPSAEKAYKTHGGGMIRVIDFHAYLALSARVEQLERVQEKQFKRSFELQDELAAARDEIENSKEQWQHDFECADKYAQQLTQAQQRIEELEAECEAMLRNRNHYCEVFQRSEAREAKLVAALEKIVELTGMPIAVMALKDFKGGG